MSNLGFAGPAFSVAAPQLCTLQPHHMQTNERAVPIKFIYTDGGPDVARGLQLVHPGDRRMLVLFVSWAGQDCAEGSITAALPERTAHGFFSLVFRDRSWYWKACAPAAPPPSGPHAVSREGRAPFSRLPENGGRTTAKEPRLRAGRGRSALRGGMKSDGKASRELPGLVVPPGLAP